MSLPNYLAKIKSTGIYRFVWDKSEIAGVDAEILRLVVGYSEKGPFNTPVYVKSATEFKNIFGDVSKKLEKRGVFFHRMALQALNAGPILALNLKKFSTEQVQAAGFQVNDQFTVKDISVEDIYDTSRFWKLNPEGLKDVAGLKPVGTDKNYIYLSATDSKESSCSVFMRAYRPTGYDVTLASWYSSQSIEMPDYMAGYENMLVSDFFAEMYVFKGEFTAAMKASSELKKYFDENGKLVPYIENAFGEKIDTLKALSNEAAAQCINIYQGILIPYFKGTAGNYISLDILFNADSDAHKMMMYLDSDKLESYVINLSDIATTGWGKQYIFGNTIDVTEQIASYVLQNWTYTDVTGKEAGAFDVDYIKYIYGINDYDTELTKPSQEEMDKIILEPSNKVALAYSNDRHAKKSFGAKFNLPVNAKKPTTGTFEGSVKVVITSDENIEQNPIELGSWSEAYPNLYKYTLTVSGKTATGWFPENLDKGLYNFAFRSTEKCKLKVEIIAYDTEGKELAKGTFSNIDINGPKIETIDSLCAEKWNATGIEVGDRFLLNNEVILLTDIKTVDSAHIQYVLKRYDGTIVAASEISSYLVKCNHIAGEFCKGLVPVYYKGYTFADAAPASMSMKDKLDWQNRIMSAIVDYPGIRLALTNRVDIDYRYIVDTFEAYVENQVHAKLSLIAKEKDNALALLNFPAIKTFKDCPYTSFTDENGNFQTKYIAEGGNKKKNPGVIFALVSEENGASFVSYNTPLVFSDGTIKTTVPSAAMVSNNFMEKYLSRQPYYIVAGPNYGKMIANGLVGPDFNYSRADLDILEPFGVNCMVYVPRLGTYINSNQTAKQNPVTALSAINVRELVIYLQDEIEKLLQNYQWEFNTQELRDKVKAKADVICENIKNNSGIYNYLNVCDESNNTDDVINNEMFVLSTSIEPARGCGKMVQELTIYKKGGMTSVIK